MLSCTSFSLYKLHAPNRTASILHKFVWELAQIYIKILCKKHAEASWACVMVITVLLIALCIWKHSVTIVS